MIFMVIVAKRNVPEVRDNLALLKLNFSYFFMKDKLLTG